MAFYIRYDDVCRTVSMKAKSWANTTGLPFEELRAQGNLILCEAVASYDETGGAKFNTWLYLLLDRGLGNYVKRERRIIAACFADINDYLDLISEDARLLERHVLLRQQLARMSSPARSIVYMALDEHAPKRFRKRGEAVEVKERIAERFVKRYGMSRIRVRHAFREIRQALAAVN